MTVNNKYVRILNEMDVSFNPFPEISFKEISESHNDSGNVTFRFMN